MNIGPINRLAFGDKYCLIPKDQARGFVHFVNFNRGKFPGANARETEETATWPGSGEECSVIETDAVLDYTLAVTAFSHCNWCPIEIKPFEGSPAE